MQSNFSNAKIGLRFPWLILLLIIFFTLAALLLAHQAIVVRHLAADNGEVNSTLAIQLSQEVGTLQSLLGALFISLIELKINLNYRTVRKFCTYTINKSVIKNNTILVIIVLTLLVDFFLVAVSIKELSNFFSGPWHPRGSIFPLYAFEPEGTIFQLAPTFFLGISAGSETWSLTKVSIERQKTILIYNLLAIIAGICLRFFASSISTQIVETSIETFMFVWFLVYLFISILSIGLENHFSGKILLYGYSTILISLLSGLAMKIGKLVSLMPVTLFFSAILIGFDTHYDLVYDELSWVIMPICFVFSFLSALAIDRTSFRGADLTDANFNKVTLACVDFSEAKLDNRTEIE